jgi:DnaJ like chaperone protein
MILGKLLGGLFGYAWLGLLGGILGIYIGHQLDKALAQNFRAANPQRQAKTQEAFFRATFVVMGFLAKADGRVSQDEIKWAEYVMGRMNLSPDMRKSAIGYFNQGKDGELDLEQELQQFKQAAGRHATLLQMFLEIQIQSAYADGELSPAELALLQRVYGQLGISKLRFEIIHQRIVAERAFAQGQHQQYGGGERHYSAPEKFAEACTVLGVKETDSDTDIKRAYRRLMSQHHPDKLVAKGLPEEMMRIAKEKTQEIQAAYETVKEYRKK